MKKTLQWIVLGWSILGAIYALTGPMPWDETLYSMLYSSLVIGLMIGELK